jgi:PIN domain nuclease of toxin-antitoxin system
MDILIDTHILIWLETNPRKIGRRAMTMLEDRANTIFISVASIYEIALKARVDRLAFKGVPMDAVNRHGFIALPISADVAQCAAALEWDHMDPFDRLIVGHSISEQMTLMSVDTAIEGYKGIPFFDATR